MDIYCEIKAFVDDGGSISPFHLIFYKPVFNKEGNDYFCKVHAPYLFKNDKCIFGITIDQSLMLAVNFVKDILGNKKIIDKHGNNVDIRVS